MIIRTLFFTTASMSIGYFLYLWFYWRQMHAIVHFEDGMLHYGTGVAVEIPHGYVGFVFPRSSIANTHLTLSNSVGVIDSGYRGEIKAKFRKGGTRGYNVGDRIAQLIIMPYPEVTFVEVDELSDSDRGEGGYGSSGR